MSIAFYGVEGGGVMGTEGESWYLCIDCGWAACAAGLVIENTCRDMDLNYRVKLKISSLLFQVVKE